MDKDVLAELLENVFLKVGNSKKSEMKENLKSLLEKIKNIPCDIKNPDNFNTLIKFDIERFLNLVVDEICLESKDYKNAYKIKFVYLNYNFFKNNIKNLVSQKEGFCCCVDKTSHIINSYMKYLLNGIVPGIENDRHFWVFNFGDYTDWFELCEGLYQLYYGKPKMYLESYKKLLDCELRNREDKSKEE